MASFRQRHGSPHSRREGESVYCFALRLSISDHSAFDPAAQSPSRRAGVGPDCGKNQPCQGRPRSSRIRSGRFLKEQDPYPRRIALLPTYPRHRWAGERKQGWESDLSPHALPHFFPHLSLGAPPATPRSWPHSQKAPPLWPSPPSLGQRRCVLRPVSIWKSLFLTSLYLSLAFVGGEREGEGRERSSQHLLN